MEILARVSGFEWGLETGVLRTTAGSLVTSVLRYSLGVIGSGAYGQSQSRIGTNIVYVMARRIRDAGLSARLPALHGAAGARTINNLYLQHAAELLDSALRAADSSIWNRPYHWVCECYGMADWAPLIDHFSPFSHYPLVLLSTGATMWILRSSGF